jgi:hypothetical protein
MGAPAQPDYAKLRRDADRLVMLLSDPHPDLATWGVVLESVMSHLVEVAPTTVLSREFMRRHPLAFPPAVGSESGDLTVEAEPSALDDPASVRIAAEMNAWLMENQPSIRRMLRETLTQEFSRWLIGRWVQEDDGSFPDHPSAVGSEPQG